MDKTRAAAFDDMFDRVRRMDRLTLMNTWHGLIDADLNGWYDVALSIKMKYWVRTVYREMAERGMTIYDAELRQEQIEQIAGWSSFDQNHKDHQSMYEAVPTLIAAVDAIVHDLEMYAMHSGPGPDTRLSNLKDALKKAKGL